MHWNLYLEGYAQIHDSDGEWWMKAPYFGFKVPHNGICFQSGQEGL